MPHRSVMAERSRNPGGTPCFRGTRVPVNSLIDYLETGGNLDRSGMRILLDENLRRKLTGLLVGQKLAVPAEPWGATSRGFATLNARTLDEISSSETELCAHTDVLTELKIWLPDMDSNHNSRRQRPLSYH